MQIYKKTNQYQNKTGELFTCRLLPVLAGSLAVFSVVSAAPKFQALRILFPSAWNFISKRLEICE